MTSDRVSSVQTRRTLLILATIVLVAAVVFWIRSSSPEEDRASISTSTTSNERTAAEPVGSPASLGSSTPAPEPGAAAPSEVASLPAPATRTPRPTPFDPEDQPRTHHLLDFRNLEQLPDGFTIDNLVLTDKGFQLQPADGMEGTPRFGVLESPPFALDFPSNAVSPLWLEDLPEGTTVFIEVAVSPDGENWGMWQAAEPDDDIGTIGESYPDGRPNPNAGHTPGGVFFWGERLWQYYRFRATLSSEVRDSPTLSTFHLFYQDSTLGRGHVAELRDDERAPR